MLEIIKSLIDEKLKEQLNIKKESANKFSHEPFAHCRNIVPGWDAKITLAAGKSIVHLTQEARSLTEYYKVVFVGPNCEIVQIDGFWKLSYDFNLKTQKYEYGINPYWIEMEMD